MLEHPENSVLTAFVGHPIYEDTPDIIRKVAKEMGWDVEEDLCVKCKPPEIETI